MLIDQINIILDPDSTEKALYEAVQALHERWSAVSQIRGDRFEPWYDQENFLGDGLAVSPAIAALCWLDTARSVTFLRGVKAAIDHVLDTIKERPIEVVYAGCGPFAALVTPLLSLYQPEELRITLLDANEPSVRSVQAIYEQEGLKPYLADVVCCDATQYTHPTPIHLLISETMQAALYQEPQVTITAQLAPQLHPNGVLVPEQIAVEAVLSDNRYEDVERYFERNSYGFCQHAGAEFVDKRVSLGTLITLDKHAQIKRCNRPVSIEIPDPKPESDLFLLTTSITVFKQWGFNDYECQLTFPHRIFELAAKEEGSQIEFVYKTGRHPTFTYFS